MLVTAMLIDGPEDCLQFEIDTERLKKLNYRVYINLYEPPAVFKDIGDLSFSKPLIAVYSARIEKGEFVFIEGNLIFDYIGER